MTKDIKSKDGATALLTVLIIGTASLIMAYTAMQLGWGEMEMGYNSFRGEQALSVAEGCADEALQRLKFDSSYTGENLVLDDKSCIINVSGSGSSRNIIVTAIAQEHARGVNLDVTLNSGNITVDSWQEN